MEIKKIQNKEEWEEFLLECEEKTFLQSWNWGEFNKKMGNKIWRFGVYENDNLIAEALIIKIVAKRGTFLFLPHGPLLHSRNSKSEILNSKKIPNSKIQILNVLLNELKKIARDEKTSFIRIAPIWERTEENVRVFKNLGFRRAPIHIHPELTWQLDITLPEEVLLMKMRKTTRYLIRQGIKNKEIEIFQSKDPKDIEIFNKLYQKTVKRHHFFPFSFDYLKNEFLSFLPDDQISIFFGKYKNEILVSAIILFWQDIAFYHHGASISSKIPASYLLQWETIKEAKRRGCKLYNFWGIADFNERTEEQNEKTKRKHPWWGLTLFKTGFGGFKKEYLKTQDLPLSKKYWFNFLIEKIRKKKRGF